MIISCWEDLPKNCSRPVDVDVDDDDDAGDFRPDMFFSSKNPIVH